MPYKFNGLPSYAGVNAPLKYANIARELGIEANNVNEAIELLTEKFEELMKDINLPLKVSQLNIDKTEYENKIDKMTVDALCDISNSANPRCVLAEDFKNFFKRAY